MALHEFGFLVVCISLGGLAVASAESLARGFGDNIAWKKFDEGLSLSKESNKPLMLVIHKSWCGACKALKPKFASSLAIENMSPEFVMVNVEDAEEPSDPQYTPDGGYIPRILFISPDGTVQEQIKNKSGNPKYKYYYSEASQVVISMREALAHFKGTKTDEL